MHEQLDKRLAELPTLYATDGVKGDIPAVYVFTPDGQGTWILWEYDPDQELAFGMCDLGFGFPEMGYVYIPELKEVRGHLGLPVEVDRYLTTRFAGMKNAGIDVPEYLKEKV